MKPDPVDIHSHSHSPSELAEIAQEIQRREQYRAANAERIRAYQKQWRADNADKVREYQKQYQKQYRTDSAKKQRRSQMKQSGLIKQKTVREYSRQYRADNPEKIYEYMKQYRAKNSDKLRAHKKQYNAEHPEKVLNRRKRYHAFIVGKDPKGAWLKKAFSAARLRAKKRGLPFDQKVPDLELPDICPVLGIPLIYPAISGNKRSANSPSLDRINPALGYVASNLRVISFRANALKNDASVEELRAVIRYMES